jgi:hypothetical protein
MSSGTFEVTGGGLHLPTPSASFTDFVGQIGHCSQAVSGFARFQRVAAEQTDMWGAYALPSACGMGLGSVVMQTSIPNEQHDAQQHYGTDRDTERDYWNCTSMPSAKRFTEAKIEVPSDGVEPATSAYTITSAALYQLS